MVRHAHPFPHIGFHRVIQSSIVNIVHPPATDYNRVAYMGDGGGDFYPVCVSGGFNAFNSLTPCSLGGIPFSMDNHHCFSKKCTPLSLFSERLASGYYNLDHMRVRSLVGEPSHPLCLKVTQAPVVHLQRVKVKPLYKLVNFRGSPAGP